MTVYRITVKGEGVRAHFDGKELDCGFFKNEFVWANDSDAAVAKALRRVRRALSRSSTVNSRFLSQVRLTVDGTQEGLGVLRLLERQGFVFYPSDHEPEATPVSGHS